MWEREIAGMGFSLPVFSSDGRRISAPFRRADGRAGILVVDTETGAEHVAADLPFWMTFRASWVDGDSALVVNRQENDTHLVLGQALEHARVNGLGLVGEVAQPVGAR